MEEKLAVETFRYIGSLMFPLGGDLPEDERKAASQFPLHFRRIPKARLPEFYKFIVSMRDSKRPMSYIVNEMMGTFQDLQTVGELKSSLTMRDETMTSIAAMEGEKANMMARVVNLPDELNRKKQSLEKECDQLFEQCKKLDSEITTARRDLNNVVSNFEDACQKETDLHRTRLASFKKDGEERCRRARAKADEEEYQEETKLALERSKEETELGDAEKKWQEAYHAAKLAPPPSSSSTPSLPSSEVLPPARVASPPRSLGKIAAPTLEEFPVAAPVPPPPSSLPLPSIGTDDEVALTLVPADGHAELGELTEKGSTPLSVVREKLGLAPDDRFIIPSVGPLTIAKEKNFTVAKYVGDVGVRKLIVRQKEPRTWLASHVHAQLVPAAAATPLPSLQQSILPSASSFVPLSSANSLALGINIVRVELENDLVVRKEPITVVSLAPDATLEQIRAALDACAAALPPVWRFLNGTAPVTPAQEKSRLVSATFVEPGVLWIKEKK